MSSILTRGREFSIVALNVHSVCCSENSHSLVIRVKEMLLSSQPPFKWITSMLNIPPWNQPRQGKTDSFSNALSWSPALACGGRFRVAEPLEAGAQTTVTKAASVIFGPLPCASTNTLPLSETRQTSSTLCAHPDTIRTKRLLGLEASCPCWTLMRMCFPLIK